jgi:aryl-alcohol dehydrogenase-like predicted oxidoreductase
MQVSQLCFGTMSFGGDADEATAAAMFHQCRDAGINFFDCANVYAEGRSEEILGRLIADCRDELVITSKVFGSMGDHVNAGGLSRRHVVQAVEDSLRRLNTDRLDIYFVHQYDVRTPIEEVVDVLDELVRQGKILYPAVSNWSAWQTATALGIAQRKDKVRFACMQPMYNLTKRQAEVELLPLAAAEQLGVIPYSPVGGGLLAGKYSTGVKPAGGRLVENAMYTKRYYEDIYFEVADRFVAHANERGVHPVSLAVAWVASHPAVTAPIIGARNPEQLQASLDALDVNMTSEWRAEIDTLSPAPALATDRSEERS